MPSWKNDDKLSSVPSWLTEEDKRRCVRTNRGWEMPLRGDGSTGGFELIVAMGQKGDPTRDTAGSSSGDQADAPYFVYPDYMVTTGATATASATAAGAAFTGTFEDVRSSTGGYTQGSFFPFIAAFPDHVLNDAGPGHFQSADGSDTSTVHLRYFVSLTAGGGGDGLTIGSPSVQGITAATVSVLHLRGGTATLGETFGGSGDFSSAGVIGTTGQGVFPGGSTLNALGIVLQPAAGTIPKSATGNPFVYIGVVAFEGTTGGVGGLTSYAQDLAGGLSAWKGITLDRE